jgi:hypothetical protein
MSLSSNSIIHFTGEKSHLKSILKSGFRPSFCKEKITFDNAMEIHVPMVSFCDIPLSKIKDHIGKYGEYGIGLTKDWAEKQGLNPVLYLQQKSYLSKSIIASIENSLSNDAVDWTGDEKRDLDVMRYIKNYQADLVRKNEIFPDYRFSDEREWRYVPPQELESEFLQGHSEEMSDEIWRRMALAMEKIRLKFHPSDIKYIIIKNDSEITEMINFLRTDMGGEYTLHEIERLTTRILTSDQIESDV